MRTDRQTASDGWSRVLWTHSTTIRCQCYYSLEIPIHQHYSILVDSKDEENLAYFLIRDTNNFLRAFSGGVIIFTKDAEDKLLIASENRMNLNQIIEKEITVLLGGDRYWCIASQHDKFHNSLTLGYTKWIWSVKKLYDFELFKRKNIRLRNFKPTMWF